MAGVAPRRAWRWPAPASSPATWRAPGRAGGPGQRATRRTGGRPGTRAAAPGRRQPGDAATAFDAVCDALPGELAAKLALGLAAEAAGDLARPRRLLPAGLDRGPVLRERGVRAGQHPAGQGDPAGAIAALASVPDTSSHHLAAQVAAVRHPGGARPGQPWSPPTTCSRRAAAWRACPLDRRSSCNAHRRGAPGRAGLRRPPGRPLGSGELLGCELTERALRFGLEAQLPGTGPAGAGPAAPDRAGGPGQPVRPGPGHDRLHAGASGPARRCRPSCGWPVGPAGQLLRGVPGRNSPPPVVSGAQAGRAPPACPSCPSARISADGYCESCGRKLPSSRDHTEIDLGLLAGVTDRGLRHHRNEDAMALAHRRAGQRPGGGGGGVRRGVHHRAAGRGVAGRGAGGGAGAAGGGCGPGAGPGRGVRRDAVRRRRPAKPWPGARSCTPPGAPPLDPPSATFVSAVLAGDAVDAVLAG